MSGHPKPANGGRIAPMGTFQLAALYLPSCQGPAAGGSACQVINADLYGAVPHCGRRRIGISN
jgi:hypothetical protein